MYQTCLIFTEITKKQKSPLLIMKKERVNKKTLYSIVVGLYHLSMIKNNFNKDLLKIIHLTQRKILKIKLIHRNRRKKTKQLSFNLLVFANIWKNLKRNKRYLPHL